MVDNEIEKIKRLKLVRNELKLSQEEFAKVLGIKRPNLSAIENFKENRKVPNNTGALLELQYSYSKEWFETGKGFKKIPPFHLGDPLDNLKKNVSNQYKNVELQRNILNEPTTAYKIREVKAVSVPIYDIEFAAGVITSLIDNREDHFPVGYLNIPEVSGCDAIIRAKGDSMADRIKDRDWIGIKRLDKNTWFPMGYIYAIETEQAQVYKIY